MSGESLFVLALAAVLVFWMLGAYNRVVALRNAIGSAWQQVDAVLAQRADAVAPLVQALRPGLPGEGAALDALLTGQAQVAAAADALRPSPVRADLAPALVRAEAVMAAASARVLALLDGHPDLRDADPVRSHATALREAEPRLQFVRQLFNDAVQAYNDAAREWPTRLLVRLYGFGTAGRL